MNVGPAPGPTSRLAGGRRGAGRAKTLQLTASKPQCKKLGIAFGTYRGELSMTYTRKTAAVWASAVLVGCSFISTVPVNVSSGPGSPDIQISSMAAVVYDHTGGQWVFASYSDWRGQPIANGTPTDAAHTMGLAVRDPLGSWAAWSPQLGASLPTGVGGSGVEASGWIASAPQPRPRAYYVSVGQRVAGDNGPSGLYVAVLDVSASTTAPGRVTPNIAVTGPIAVGAYGGSNEPLPATSWYEPTIAVTRQPTATDDTLVIVAPDVDDDPNSDSQNSLYAWVSGGSATAFRPAAHPHIYPPGYSSLPHPGIGPGDSTFRPILQQDARPGHECTEYLAFVVGYPSAIAGVPCFPCSNDQSCECNGIAETISTDCGDTWSPPGYVVRRGGTRYEQADRNYAYAVGDDGARYLAWEQTAPLPSPPGAVQSGIYMLVAPPDAPFGDVTTPAITVTAPSGTTQRTIPAIAAARGTIVVTYDESDSWATRVVAAVASTANPRSWSAYVLRGSVAAPCSNEQLGALNALVSLGSTPPSYVATWTQLGAPSCSIDQYNVFAATLTPPPPPEPVTNPCGGAQQLAETPGGSCVERSTGACGLLRCAGPNAVTCDTTRGSRNPCGGCSPMIIPGVSGGLNSRCSCNDPAESQGYLTCSADGNRLVCCPCNSARGCGPGSP